MSKLAKLGFVISLFQFLAMIAAFLRNVLLARMLAPSDVGVCMLITLLIATLDQIFSSGIRQFIVQYSGAKPSVPTVQSYQAIRGFAMSAIFVCLSPVFAQAAGNEGLTALLLAVSATFFIKGFANCSIYADQKAFSFKAANFSEALGNVAALIGTAIGGYIYEDSRTIVVSVLMQAAVYVASTHLLCKTRVSFGLDMSVARELASFGTPLLVNGVLLTLTINGDRLALFASSWFNPAYSITLEDFARYSVCVGLLYTLSMSILNVSTSIMLPAISAAKSDNREVQRLTTVSAEGLAIVAGVLTVAFSVFGIGIIQAVYGPSYVMSRLDLTLLAIAFSLRMFRSIPNTLSMAYGDTNNTLLTSVIRALAIPMSFFGIFAGYEIFSVVFAAVIAESLALPVGLFLVRDRQGAILVSLAIAKAYVPVAAYCSVAMFLNLRGGPIPLFIGLVLCVAYGVMLFYCTSFFAYTISVLLHFVRSRLWNLVSLKRLFLR